MIEPSIKLQEIIKVESNGILHTNDVLAIEEPLEISLSIIAAQPPIFNKNISITMRTPGNDLELALGFLFTEGIIVAASQIDNSIEEENTIQIQLNTSQSIDLSKIERHFYTSSSCGVCGKSSIDAIKTVSRLATTHSIFKVKKELVKKLPIILREKQLVFEKTGGLHAAALFNLKGDLLVLKEDVGRHNALDKLIGYAFQKKKLPLDKHMLLLSGRASFELIQKASMAGIKFIGAVGAPSSLAVSLAKEFNITLIGFLNKTRFNIYTGAERIEL